MITNNGTSQLKRKTSRGRLPDGSSNPVDIYVGNRIRLRRNTLKMSQERLADLLGITFQQIQKYERGMNRIGASRLWDVSKVLGVPVSYFFEEMAKDITNQSPRMFHIPQKAPVVSEDETILKEVDPLYKKETLELIAAYYKIHNRNLAQKIYEIIQIASKSTYDEKKENMN